MNACKCNKWKVNQTANLCRAWQLCLAMIRYTDAHTHRNIFHLVFYTLPLLLRTSVTHFLGYCTFPLRLRRCPSATPSSILRAVKRRSQHAVLPEACTINTSSMEARNLKSGLVAPRLSYWKLNTYTFYIIYRYINIYTHTCLAWKGRIKWEKCDIIYCMRWL